MGGKSGHTGITGILPLKVLISLDTQMTDNQSVPDKEITPQAIAIDRFYLRGDL
jgi:hypothetical protein